MELLRSVNLLLAFLLELAMLAALGYGGFHFPADHTLQILIGIGAPLLAIILWSLMLAPNAKHRPSLLWIMLMKSALFGAAALMLALAQQNLLALIFAALVILNFTLAAIWKQL